MKDISFELKRGKFNKKNIVWRIIFSPFIISVLTIAYFRIFIVGIFDYFWYGGEIVHFNNQINRDSLSHMLSYFEQLINEDKNTKQ
jgi:hypothetical protein